MTKDVSEEVAIALTDRAVLFDLDGTLVDSWQVAKQAFCFAYRRATSRESPPVDAFEARLGRPFPEILRELDLPLSMHAHFIEYSQQNAHTIRPFAGVMPALAALRAAGIRIGVVTGKDRPRSEQLLKITGLNAYVHALTTPDDAPGKPDPASLFDCLHQLGCSPFSSAYVGDALADMECGRRAKVLRVFAKWGALRDLDAGEYDHVATDPAQIQELFLSWAGFRHEQELIGVPVVAC
jgi:HAD superfamily hydrolase (TIGR01549 family)